MNVVRGFNRLFVVLSILWVVYCLVVFPLQIGHDTYQSYLEARSKCYDHPVLDSRDCLKMWDDILLPDVKEWSLPNYYRTKWPYILLAVTVIPAVVYGIFRLIGLGCKWVY